MKKKDLIDLKNKSALDLRRKIKDIQLEMTNSILELKMGKVKNVHEANTKRKDLARALTFLNLNLLVKKTQEVETKKTKTKE